MPGPTVQSRSFLAALVALGGLAPTPPRVRDGSPRGIGQPVTPRAGPRVGRNDPCPCGSGKKRKKCCK